MPITKVCEYCGSSSGDGGGGSQAVQFLADPRTGAIMQESDNSNPSGLINSNSASRLATSSVNVPGGSTLDQYIIHNAVAEIYFAALSRWGTTGFAVNSSFQGRGVNCDIKNGNELTTMAGNGSLGASLVVGLGSAELTQVPEIQQAFVRLRITASLR